METSRLAQATGALFGLLGVIAGSLTAHPIRPYLESVGQVANYELANSFLLFHGLALLAVASLYPTRPAKALRLSALFLALGSLLFCGTLYLKAWLPLGPLGVLTPTGGLLLMLGWLSLLAGAFARPSVAK